MKNKLGTLLILVLTLSMLSFSVFAVNGANTDPNTQVPANNENTQGVPAQTPAAQTPPAQAPATQTPPAQTPPTQNVVAPTSIVASADNVSWDKCVILSDDIAKNGIKYIETVTEYPIVIDLSDLGSNIDSIVIPSNLYKAILSPLESKEETPAQQPQPPAASDDQTSTPGATTSDATAQGTTPGATQGTTNTVPQPINGDAASKEDKNEVILKLVFEEKECLFKRETLEELEADGKAVTLVLSDADQVVSQPVEEKGSAVVDFEPKDSKTYGTIFVSKDADGNWSSTGTFLFDSMMMYVITKILLVVITFAVIICVNLLIIKLYRLKK